MVCICQDRQPIGIVRHVLMQLLREFLSVAVLVYNRRNDVRKQHIILIRAELLPIQIQPTEQVLFLRRELDKPNAVAAVMAMLSVTTAVIIQNMKPFPYMPGVQRDGPLCHGSFQIVHALKGQIDRLGGAAQFLCHTTRVDGCRATLTQHIHCRIYDGLFGYFFDCRHFFTSKITCVINSASYYKANIPVGQGEKRMFRLLKFFQKKGAVALTKLVRQPLSSYIVFANNIFKSVRFRVLWTFSHKCLHISSRHRKLQN